MAAEPFDAREHAPLPEGRPLRSPARPPVPASWAHRLRASVLLAALLISPSCSVKKYAVNKIGDTLAEGTSVYETDDDLILVGEALPFALKLVEGLLQESPEHRGLLLTACRGYVLYTYAYVHFDADKAAMEDFDRARELRARARKLYLRAFDYGLRAVELDYPSFGERLASEPGSAVAEIGKKHERRELPLLYWSAAALGLAISVSKNDAAMLARIPEVDAMLARGLLLEESWEEGAFHEFAITLAAAETGPVDQEALRRHYERALALSRGRKASLYVAYAEAVSIPSQNRDEFLALMDKALAVNPDAEPRYRLMNTLALRRATWLLNRVDELFLEEQPSRGGESQ